MTVESLITAAVSVLGSGLVATLLTHRRKAAAIERREVTAQHRIDDGAHARGEQILERTLGAKTAECAECQEQLTAERTAHTATQREHAATRVHLATCEQDRVHTRAINRWLAARVDKLDGGSIPPFPLDDSIPAPEPAE